MIMRNFLDNNPLTSCLLLKVSVLHVVTCDVVGDVVWGEDFFPVISL